MRTRIKICGITRAGDAELVAESGADAMGMIFYEKSPRYVNVDQAKGICNAVTPYLTTVAVVVNPAQQQLVRLARDIGIDRFQFHGDESALECERAGRPYYKVLRVGQDTDIAQQTDRFPSASAFLLDTYVKNQPGGTGLTFDWSKINQVQVKPPLILAGGLTPANVYDAILACKPYAVDANSGVEIKPGIKDAIKINEFIIAVQEADQALYKSP